MQLRRILEHQLLATTKCTLAALSCTATLFLVGDINPAQAGAGHHHDHTETAQQPDVTIGSVPVANNITMLMGVGGFTGGNVGVSTGADGLLIIDDKLEGFSEKLKAALDKFGKGKPKYILNTHWHFDHTGGNASFPRALIIAHDTVRDKMSKPQEIKSIGRKVPASPAEALPDLTYSGTLTLHFNDDEIQIFHMPNGHTNGDSIVYFKKANVLHLGDLFFKGMLPFADTEHGGNAFAMTRNIGEILKRFPTDAKVIPGHGALGTMADLKAYHEMLQATTEHVRKGAEAGKDLTALKAAGLPEKWKAWEWQFITSEKWIETIHASL